VGLVRVLDLEPVWVGIDILPALKREDSHGTAPLSWDIMVYLKSGAKAPSSRSNAGSEATE